MIRLLELFLHRIKSSLSPGITSTDTSESPSHTDDDSFFFDRLDHIVTAARDMFTIGRSIHRLRPEWMIRREVFLILSDDWSEDIFEHDYVYYDYWLLAITLPIHSLDSFIHEWANIWELITLRAWSAIDRIEVFLFFWLRLFEWVECGGENGLI